MKMIVLVVQAALCGSLSAMTTANPLKGDPLISGVAADSGQPRQQPAKELITPEVVDVLCCQEWSSVGWQKILRALKACVACNQVNQIDLYARGLAQELCNNLEVAIKEPFSLPENIAQLVTSYMREHCIPELCSLVYHIQLFRPAVPEPSITRRVMAVAADEKAIIEESDESDPGIKTVMIAYPNTLVPVYTGTRKVAWCKWSPDNNYVVIHYDNGHTDVHILNALGTIFGIDADYDIKPGTVSWVCKDGLVLGVTENGVGTLDVINSDNIARNVGPDDLGMGVVSVDVGAAITVVEGHPSTPLIAVGHDNGDLSIVDYVSGHCGRSTDLYRNCGALEMIRWSPSGSSLLVQWHTGTAAICSVVARRVKTHVYAPDATDAQWSADGALLFLMSPHGIHIHNGQSGALLVDADSGGSDIHPLLQDAQYMNGLSDQRFVYKQPDGSIVIRELTLLKQYSLQQEALILLALQRKLNLTDPYHKQVWDTLDEQTQSLFEWYYEHNHTDSMRVCN